MKKYLIKEIYNDDDSIYFDSLKDDIINNFTNDIMIGYNKEYNGYNFDIINVINNNLIDYCSYDVDVYYNNNFYSYIIDYLKPYKKISLKQAINISKLIKNNIEPSSRYDSQHKQLVLDILSVIFNKTYHIRCLRGYCQSDWIYCIYSDDINNDFIDYIEAVYFNTGIELYISCNKIDIDDDIDINNYEYDGYYDYAVDHCNIENKKQAAASLIGCDVNDIIYYSITNVKTRTIVHYDIDYKKI